MVFHEPAPPHLAYLHIVAPACSSHPSRTPCPGGSDFLFIITPQFCYSNKVIKELVKVEKLSKRYSSTEVVHQVSFAANAGQIFGLLGPNGAGKTTTIRVLSTVLTPSGGSATVCGNDIRQNPAAVRRSIGLLTTDIGVYARFSGRENLEYYGQLYGLNKADLTRRIAELAQLLDMERFIDQKAGAYSTGMKQKLAIARAVIHDPEVIIFDEPTSGLDVLAAQTVLSFMAHAKKRGRAVIFSTHHLPDAERLCDQVAIMHQGKIIENNTVAKILRSTKTTNLEDAFLSLINVKPAVK